MTYQIEYYVPVFCNVGPVVNVSQSRKRFRQTDAATPHGTQVSRPHRLIASHIHTQWLVWHELLAVKVTLTEIFGEGVVAHLVQAPCCRD
jgi:hypothetical protein